MPGLRPGKTLFEVVPALGAISAHGGAVAKLMPVGFDHPGLTLVEGLNRIGRDPSQNNHVISSSHISRSHCEVVVNEGRIWVKDLESHNGCYVNSERITRQELQPGDKLGLSRRITFVLAMDQDLQNPQGMEFNLDQESGELASSASSTPSPMQITPSEVGKEPTSAGPRTPQPMAVSDGDEDSQESTIKHLEQQRNVLAILYQVTLRCLMADNQKEVEQLLTNVQQRLVQLDSGFILYQVGQSWRATICPNSRYRPDDQTVRRSYRLAAKEQKTLVLEDASDLEQLGLNPHGSVMVIPMMLGDTMTGVMGAISGQQGVYTAEVVDIMQQLANVAAAALRPRQG